jgi:hypothetical protein
MLALQPPQGALPVKLYLFKQLREVRRSFGSRESFSFAPSHNYRPKFDKTDSTIHAEMRESL